MIDLSSSSSFADCVLINTNMRHSGDGNAFERLKIDKMFLFSDVMFTIKFSLVDGETTEKQKDEQMYEQQASASVSVGKKKL